MGRNPDIISILDSLGQLKRFHRLSRYEPATYEDAVEYGVEVMDTPFGWPVVIVLFMGWNFDYS